VQQVVNVITEPFPGRIIVLAPLEDKEIVPFGGAFATHYYMVYINYVCTPVYHVHTV
jgi:hypothetical protein